MSTSIAIFEAIKFEKLLPSGSYQAVAGHSLGEYSALVANNSIDYETPAESNDKYSYKNVDNWNMPEEYKQLDIQTYLFNKTKDYTQKQRVEQELAEFESRNMIPMLKFLVYMVTELKHNNILLSLIHI